MPDAQHTPGFSSPDPMTREELDALVAHFQKRWMYARKHLEPVMAVSLNDAGFTIQQGSLTKEEAARVMAPENIRFISRGLLEDDLTHKQVVAYNLVFDQDNRILMHTRSREVGDERLRGACSIGFGGHVELADLLKSEYSQRPPVGSCVVDFAAYRELLEELRFGCAFRLIGHDRPPWLINDDSNDVGMVHIGCVYMWRAADYTCVTANDNTVTALKWCTLDELQAMDQQGLLESWSAICVRKFIADRND